MAEFTAYADGPANKILGCAAAVSRPARGLETAALSECSGIPIAAPGHHQF
jgi:hypothetical protein